MDGVVGTPTVRKPFKDKLCPTPAQQRAFAHLRARCRALYHAGREERREAWRRCHGTASRCQHTAQLKDLRAEIPE